MLTNGGDTEGLFRAGWMESGTMVPTGSFSKLQPRFDFMVEETGCGSAADALACLREVPAETIAAAMDKTPTFLSFQVRLVVLADEHALIICLNRHSTPGGCPMPTACFSGTIRRNSSYKAVSHAFRSSSVRLLCTAPMCKRPLTRSIIIRILRG